MHSDLERYLNDHLGGSSGAVDLIQALVDSDGAENAAFFARLKGEVEADRVLLKDLIQRLGGESSILLQATGSLSEKVGRVKLLWEGLAPGRLGAFEAMEMLVLGIHGKCLLWSMLGQVAESIPEWSGVDFGALEKQAVEQRDAVEKRRLQAGLKALSGKAHG